MLEVALGIGARGHWGTLSSPHTRQSPVTTVSLGKHKSYSADQSLCNSVVASQKHLCEEEFSPVYAEYVYVPWKPELAHKGFQGKGNQTGKGTPAQAWTVGRTRTAKQGPVRAQALPRPSALNWEVPSWKQHPPREPVGFAHLPPQTTNSYGTSPMN